MRSSAIRVERPPLVFRLLAEDEIDLDTLKRDYIRAVYYRTKSMRAAARILKIADYTVRKYVE
jgi:hypothetical protein